MKEILSVLAGVLYIIGFIPYILAILRQETKPAKASWLIWASLNTIICVGMWLEDTVNGQILGALIGAWVVAALALRYGTPGWTKFDKFCLGGAALGIGLLAFASPVLSMMISLIVAFIGSMPTFASAWHNPDRENKLAWTIFWVSGVCAIIAIPHWTLANAAQPITFFTIDAIITGIVYLRPRPLAAA